MPRGRTRFFAGQVREEIHAIQLRLGWNFHTCESKGGRVQVELNDGLVDDLAGRDVSLPLHEERHADAPFPDLGLEAVQWGVAGRGARGRTAIVTDKDDEGIILETKRPYLGQNHADIVVHRREHRGERPAPRVGDVAKSRGICRALAAARGRR